MLKNCVTALVTPMKNGEVDYQGYKKLIDFQLKEGVKAFIVNGTTGEASTLTFEEKREAVKFVLENVPADVTIGVGVSSNDTHKMIKEIENVEDLDFEYLLITTPYYNKTNQKGLIAHIEEAIKATSKKIILYNVPGRTGLSFSIDTIETLAKHEQVVAYKEASGNINYAQELFLRLGDKIDIFCGNDDLNYIYALLGAKGTISVLGNVAGGKCNEMYNYIQNNDLNSARRIHLKLLDLSYRLFDDVNPILVKALLSKMGIIENELRLPLVSEDGELADKLFEVYKKAVN